MKDGSNIRHEKGGETNKRHAHRIAHKAPRRCCLFARIARSITRLVAWRLCLAARIAASCAIFVAARGSRGIKLRGGTRS